ncbi:hypothetical protein NITHO_3380005 [Nitrolancea hollandica Lb]|uniref:Uncharacterized protein n=1 Tax=Nitrolancea hollandica Lb TaxID=1129897 RepID=I4EI89_9BACT|nr:hypothetical protein NITHO_3380005 [Nitrolancea hollandica Lb]
MERYRRSSGAVGWESPISLEYHHFPAPNRVPMLKGTTDGGRSEFRERRPAIPRISDAAHRRRADDV